MTLEEVKERAWSGAPFAELRSRLAGLAAGACIDVAEAPGSMWSLILARAAEGAARRLLVVAASEEAAEELCDDLIHLGPQAEVRLFASESAVAKTDGYSQLTTNQVEALKTARDESRWIIVAALESLRVPLPGPAAFGALILSVRLGEHRAFEGLIDWLASRGFERKRFVESYGDAAVRGGIVDVFPSAGDNPIRMEFEGDTVESIREFDVLSQRSIRVLDHVDIVPVIEAGDETPSGGWGAVLLDYIASDAVVALSDEVLASPKGAGMGSLDASLHERIAAHPCILLRTLSGESRPDVIRFRGLPQPAFNGSVQQFRRHLASLDGSGVQVAVLCEEQALGDRLKELIESIPEDGDGEEPPPVEIIIPSLHHGFSIPSERIALYTEHEVFNRRPARAVRCRGPSRGLSIREIKALHRGDFVVHVDYGIGKFSGLQKIRVRGAEQETVKLLYAEGGVLYVNLNYLNRIQKYSSRDGVVSTLSTLGSSEWEKLKNRTKKRIKDIARDLLLLYARRKSEKGFAFSPDSPWQKEMEASFIYEDTPDQARTTLDVKHDMEAEIPADRLVCGDAGFGKTEIAIRAAFKAVMDGKQVAVLVPTTILAMQHYQTFLDRVGKYGVSLDVLSRFRTRREQEETLARLKEGKVDILIGTHRILSSDVEFRDIGLLIIDEEQRFGVSAKEKIRALKATVDTLTLSATPIPRTLHLALMGARDLSILGTPPRNRLPVDTKVMQFETPLIRGAILREKHRGGQAFLVGDRIHALDELGNILSVHVPEVTWAIAHGQMHAHELERVMVKFLERKIDVLVVTKIIESGLDMPNVNTIVVNRADRFGLSELYQLRGRVGRSNLQAYAYLLTPPFSSITRTALRRLQTLEEFTEFGAGFAIAMRDLEIRGAGNLLGAEQSGFIEGLGFELYEKILDEAVEELKSEEFPDLMTTVARIPSPAGDVVIETDVDALIPEWYVDDMTERLDIYRRLYAASDAAAIGEIRDELFDRFGKLPGEVEHLIETVHVRLLARRLGLVRVTVDGDALELSMPDKEDEKYYNGEIFRQILVAIQSGPLHGFRLRQDRDRLSIAGTLKNDGRADKLTALGDLLSRIAA